ncbi:porin [Thioclava indica]|uniref:Porin domain-containing protein n=1 Tax=Thioclava indica TaxID=1353528 RepID=A0A074JYP9_9RHOB|nr:porin [Thioclava indica]KEO60673.1 hypothetical protein DT23_12585 [Thioclava indica]
MKQWIFGAVAALAASTALTAQAAEVSGAQVGVSYSNLTGSASDADKLSAFGSLEVAFSSAFSVQGDMALNRFGGVDWNGGMFALHGVYHPMQGTAVGAFVGRDRLNSQNVDFYGLEASQKLNIIDLEGYLWHTETGTDGTALGLSGSYALNDRFSLGGRLDAFNGRGDDYNRIGVTADYKLASSYSVYGEIGRVDAQDADAEGYIGLGVRATFGAGQGTTFSQRGLQDLLPGL